MAYILTLFAAITPIGDSDEPPKGAQAYLASLGRFTQKASDAYAMRYAAIECLAVRSSLGGNFGRAANKTPFVHRL